MLSELSFRLVAREVADGPDAVPLDLESVRLLVGWQSAEAGEHRHDPLGGVDGAYEPGRARRPGRMSSTCIGTGGAARFGDHLVAARRETVSRGVPEAFGVAVSPVCAGERSSSMVSPFAATVAGVGLSASAYRARGPCSVTVRPVVT